MKYLNCYDILVVIMNNLPHTNVECASEASITMWTGFLRNVVNLKYCSSQHVCLAADDF